jgi:hypothetical protein
VTGVMGSKAAVASPRITSIIRCTSTRSMVV